jgi:two-component system, chemotaxis family, sensor kinase CheA
MDNDSLQQQLIRELLIEGFDGLEKFDQQLVALEEGTADDDTLNTIFRVIHTIKGTAGCIGLQKIASVAHVGENLLSLLRDGDLETSAELIDALLHYSDALKEMLHTLESTGDQGSKDYSDLVNQLHRLQDPEHAEHAESPALKPALKPAPATTPEPPVAAAPTEASDGSWGVFEDEPSGAPSAPPTDEGQAWGLFEGDDATPAPKRAQPVAAATPERHAPVAAAASAPTAAAHGSVSESAIRVDVGQLDRLMNLVGELVLARNQIMQHASQSRGLEPSLVQASQRLNIITTELQESVMKTRMQPIETIWNKFPRIVRDVAHELGKQVNLVMEGKSTELDRTIIEAIRDPLTHIIRNAIDHGIEMPAARTAAGKVEAGTLILRAFHEGGQVIIEIMDDGGGINTARVRQKAVEKGLITAEAAAKLGDREAFDLVFLPGFSTAEHITNISGRGVGMDVVKTNVEKIGGSVDVQSELGNGTTFRIKIPLTLAIIPALVVSSCGERFAIPQVSLLELVRLEGEEVRKGIELLYGSPVHRLRGTILPLASINRELGLVQEERIADREVVTIVVLQADGRQFGLIVDEVNDTEEIVVKPLGKQLRGLPCYAGATIMGDGRVALILDVLGFAHHSRIISETLDHTTVTDKHGSRDDANRQSLLLCRTGDGERMAIPLSIVARLEEFGRERLERAGGRSVVQYRDRIMPLVRLDDAIAGRHWSEAVARDAKPDEPLQVVVWSDGKRSVGLVVDHIEDIVEESIALQAADGRRGVLGSAVIQRHVTTLLDLPVLIECADRAEELANDASGEIHR